MPIIFRGTKGSRLTVAEIDGNFQTLAGSVNTKVDSANVIGIVDSAYVQARQTTYDFLDSAEAIALIDSAYVQARQVDLQRDSSFITNLIDSSHVQARQDNSYGSLTGTPTNLSQFHNDKKYLDSSNATSIVDSAYVQARQTTYDFLDSAEAIALIDSAHVQARQVGISSHTTTDLAEGTRLYYTTSRADSDAKQALTGSTGVTYNRTTGEISIGQPVGVTDSVNFQGLQVDNLVVAGTQTTVNTQTLNVVDPMIKMANGNQQNINDIGFYGQYSLDAGTTVRHTGLFRDASDDNYYLYQNLVDSPTSFVNRSGTGFELATLNVGTINATNILDSNHIEDMITSLSTDSAAVFLLVDSDYIQARQIQQDFAYGSLTGAPTNVSTFTNDANYVSDLLNIASNLVPDTDSARDLGTSSKKWRELHLSGNTIFLGTDQISADNGELKVNNKSLYDFSSPSDGLVEVNDKYIETSDELTDAQAPTDPQVVFNTWNRFSHLGTSQPLANQSDLDAWSYNSGTGAVENANNTASATGFYSPRKYDSYTHEATLKSGGSDDDILGVIIGYVIEDGKHYTLSAIRQTTGNIIQSGLQWGLVYNINQDHTDNTRDQALLANGTSTAGGATQGWSSFTNGTKVRVRKIGASLSIKTSQWNSTSIDDTTEITFDLNSDSRTQRFAGSVPYGYVAWSQGPASFNGLSFTPDTPESIIHFKDNGATTFYEYNSGTSAWDVDTSSTLGDRKGKFYHNDKTGRTFFNDGDNVTAIGTVRQFNDVLYQVPQSSAPTATTIGALGLKPGMFAVADGVNWDPVNKNSTYPYPVFWDGTQWNALY
tara:strand:- start:1344 stop:3821 length:2478 start_codon:yes stop_codon:yes gene_type:complete